jgi:hypothetical protein
MIQTWEESLRSLPGSASGHDLGLIEYLNFRLHLLEHLVISNRILEVILIIFFIHEGLQLLPARGLVGKAASANYSFKSSVSVSR